MGLYRIWHNYFTPNSNDLNPCKNVLKNQKFPGKIIFTGQKRGWSFARKETPSQTQMGQTPAKTLIWVWGGGGEIVVSNTVKTYKWASKNIKFSKNSKNLPKSLQINKCWFLWQFHWQIFSVGPKLKTYWSERIETG